MKKEYDFSKGKRGPVLPQAGRTRITITLSEDVITALSNRAEAAGVGLQFMMDDALRAHLENTGQPFEEALRRVIREELRAAS